MTKHVKHLKSLLHVSVYMLYILNMIYNEYIGF